MKRRILVLCLLLALVFMAIAVPVDAVGITLVKNVVEDPPNRFCVGKTINYEMIVGNPDIPGNVNLTLNVTDTYPNGAVELLEANLSLAVGENKTYNRSYVVKAGDVGWIINTLSVNGFTELGLPVSASVVMPSFILRPEINITKVASPTSGAPSTDVYFTITVTNTGDCILDLVKVVDTLPSGMSYVSDNSSGTVSGQEITWDLGSKGPGASTTILLVAQIDGGACGDANK